MTVNIEKVNEVLEEYYKLFYKTEDMALKRGIKSLTHTELHIIESVGQDSLTMNELSEKIGITMGTATVAISKLADKGYMDRVRSSVDRRKVFVSLTKKGFDALTYHNNYHKMIMASITENIPGKDLEKFVETFEVILNALRNKTDYFKPMTITDFPEKTKVSIVEIKGTPIVQNYFASHGIENFTILRVLRSEDKSQFTIQKENGEILTLDILDAKNLIGVKAD
ncbi:MULTISPECIES: MarR family winged helix-turn-helix transcriptional regulator [Fusobacterium]|uniref:MarR family winged helix-turn-helix transcriptional regulator n=1 Tax=Fusobacterium TaxID=848 RepID=UPI001F4F46AC|nr:MULTISPECIES: MarR family winged helix-turn-helix transcriptional regulator [Fusobacterium]MDD7392597.1 MarR family winged helix-turn-helix transcriptional regulator [Fusobacteriaceae bacterium]MCI5724658.1 MarR family winged helix-turn-helix transcriptional regulator [Fusobacterium sp.]MCI7223690.1 MarR family winged helix-turn-helix transcriptional regulator [Fusobacterium sp.]MDD7411378.1 MarR family winged helix-turn-helix transcriptional regulator [Fusobacteriaceae bacterium]MDY5305865